MVGTVRGMMESQLRYDNENFRHVMDLCGNVIEMDYAPCGLEGKIEDRIYELVLIWENKKERAIKENMEIGGLNIIFHDVLRAIGKAEADERRFGKKTKCQHLRNGLETPIGIQGALGNYSRAFWCTRSRND